MRRTINRLHQIIRGEGALKEALSRRYKGELDAFLAGANRLAFPQPIEPLLSVLLPVHNGAHHTLRCLNSLLTQASSDIEVIVYDDASTDRTSLLLARTSGLQIVCSKTNSGFIGAVNAAASAARGAILLLLNSDAVVREGNVTDAAKLLNSSTKIGALGARIALATGKLQEAGCYILQDGSTHGYLRGCSVDDGRALLPRIVDYCSGAFLMVKTEAFRALGGLDPIYAPAYYEESDLCMRLRRLGMHTLYLPDIIVDHFEFGSQVPQHARAAIAEKRTIFLARWQETLRAEGFCTSQHSPEEAAMRLASETSRS